MKWRHAGRCEDPGVLAEGGPAAAEARGHNGLAWDLLAVASFAGWIGAAAVLRYGWRKTRWLQESEPAADAECPPLSIVVAACNEAGAIEPAMRTLLAIDYPGLEIVAVEDRSTDNTGEILDRLALSSPRLTVIHLTELPPGWLGKNHALFRGAAASAGQFILFTDADVLFAPDALRRAAALVGSTQADLLAVAPGMILQGFWERLLVSYFIVLFTLNFRTWDVSSPSSSAYVGIGAFNLVRRSAYEDAGGHRSLPMDVADDVKLGKVMKTAGKRLVYALGGDVVRVRWIAGIDGFVSGLTKNMFAGIEYRWLNLVGLTLLLGSSHILPLAGLFVGSRAARRCFGGAVLGMAAAAVPAVPRRRGPGRKDLFGGRGPVRKDLFGGRDRALVSCQVSGALFGFAYPLACAVWLFTMWRSAVLAETRGGVEWRGTFYPLDELRRNVK